MHLHFSSSFGFDNVYPKLVTKAAAAKHGELQRGSKGLLEWFEMHLGLKGEDSSDLLRISPYKTAIAKAIEDHPDLYISSSYLVDAWGTTKQLLRWRDELQLALWDFDCDDESLPRLYTLSVVEGYLTDLPPGINDRWRLLLDKLEQKEDLPFLTKMTIYEPEASTNPFFLVLFNVLEQRGVKIIYNEPKYNFDETDLGRFKTKLLNQSKIDKVSPLQDGTLTILRADNAKLIAKALASKLAKSKQLQPLFIIPERGELLEQAMINRGLPAMGYTASYEDGVLGQLLHLVTLFLWDPYDPEKLIQFLSIQISPIDTRLRVKLAEAYAEVSLVGSEKWQKAIENYRAYCEKNNPSRVKTIQPKLDRWFSRQRYTITEGAPSAAVIQLYSDLKAWADSFVAKMHQDDHRLGGLKQLSNQCKTLIEVIKLEKSESGIVDALALTKWIEELSASSYMKAQQAELGAYSQVSNPAALSSTADTVIWWNFLESSNPLSTSANWSEDEKLQLKSTYLYTDEMKLDHWYWKLCNGILSCDKRLILCLPDKSNGELANVSQLYYDLEATFTELESLTDYINPTVAQRVLDEDLEIKSYPAKALPRRKATWNIAFKNVPERREQDSYSSLSKLFIYPYAYVLKYLFMIKSTQIPQVTISSLLLGNLTHHAAEDLWGDKKLLEYNEEELKKVVSRVLDEQIQKAGIVLLMPKNKSSLQEFREKTSKSLLHLVKLIKENGWTILESEKKHTLNDEIPIQGYIDLVLERKGEIAIVDLKWGGASTRLKELIEERELQLIIYDRLLKEKDKRIYLHYYIISSSKMLGRTKTAFEETITIETEEDALTHRKAIWDRMVNTYRLRWAQLEQGHLEVGDGMSAADIAGSEELYDNENKDYLDIPVSSIRTGRKKEEDKYSEYTNLIGRI